MSSQCFFNRHAERSRSIQEKYNALMPGSLGCSRDDGLGASS